MGPLYFCMQVYLCRVITSVVEISVMGFIRLLECRWLTTHPFVVHWMGMSLYTKSVFFLASWLGASCAYLELLYYDSLSLVCVSWCITF